MNKKGTERRERECKEKTDGENKTGKNRRERERNGGRDSLQK